MIRVFVSCLCLSGLVGCAGASSGGATEEEYVACGCGCCEGEPGDTRCVANREELRRIEAEDEEDESQPSCAERDCQAGIRYVVCE